MSAVYEVVFSPVGEILLAEIECELAAVLFLSGDRASDAIERLSKYYPSFKFVAGQVSNAKNIARLLNGENVVDKIPVSCHVYENCSQFRRAVFGQLQRIPRGLTRSYGEIASLLGRPTAYRAVAQACASNVLCIVIPCHRVVASDGTLGGFGGGLAVKRQLLKLEGALDGMKN